MATSRIVFVLLCIFIIIIIPPKSSPCHAARIQLVVPTTKHHDYSTAQEFIVRSCGSATTNYPAHCVRSVDATPMQLASTALSLALLAARSASAAIANMSAAHPGTSPRVAAALSDCVETVGDSVEWLARSKEAMRNLAPSRGGDDFEFQLNSIQTWVSAAITDYDTCMDGFEGVVDGGVKREVRRRMVHLSRLTINALALINALAAAYSAAP